MHRILSLLVPVLALLGVLDASYITYEKFSGVIPPCLPGFACAQVLQSPWASIGPVPLSLLGVLFYTTVLVVSSAVFLGFSQIKIGEVPLSLTMLERLLTRFGALFSLYLVSIMAFLIQGWCLWCLISACICALLFLTVELMTTTMEKKVRIHEYPLRLSFLGVAYSLLLKPMLFLTNPEWVHHRFLSFGNLLGRYVLTRTLTERLFGLSLKKKHTSVADIRFPSLIGLAAGFDYDGQLPKILPSIGFGFATIGTVTLHPYGGNPSPMLGRLPKSKALLVNKGFKSQGAPAVIAHLSRSTFSIPIGISIGSTNKLFSSLSEQIQDIASCFTLFEKSKVKHSYYELNISCPNTKGGQPFTTPKGVSALLHALEKLHIQKPVFIKMPIDKPVKETLQLLESIAKSPLITGVVIGNLTKDHANPDIDAREREVWNTRAGNLSGKPTWNRSNTLIAATRQAFGKRFVIIGTGGVFSGADAAEKIRLGADLVQLITGMVYNGPELISRINWELQNPKA